MSQRVSEIGLNADKHNFRDCWLKMAFKWNVIKLITIMKIRKMAQFVPLYEVFYIITMERNGTERGWSCVSSGLRILLY